MPLVQPGYQEQPVLQVLPALPDQQAQTELQEVQGQQDLQEQRVLPDWQVLPVIQVLPDLPDQQVPLEPEEVPQDLPGQLAQREPQVYQVQRVHPE